MLAFAKAGKRSKRHVTIMNEFAPPHALVVGSTSPAPLQTSQGRWPVPPHSSQSYGPISPMNFLPVPLHARQEVVLWPWHLGHNVFGIARALPSTLVWMALWERSRDSPVRDLPFPPSRSHAPSRLHRDDIRRRWAKAGGNDAALNPCRSLWGSAKDRGQQSRGTKKIIFGRRRRSAGAVPPETEAALTIRLDF